MTYQNYLNTKYFKSFDGIRCLSILMVISGHVYSGHNEVSLFLINGFLGVDIFFVISGFLITTLILREYNQKSNFLLYSFCIRRVLRIFPAYYFSLILLILFAYFAKDNDLWTQDFWHELPWTATFLSNIIISKTVLEITWSLSTEEQFYLIWPTIIYLFKPKKALLIIIIFTILNMIFSISGIIKYFNFSEFSLAKATFFPLCAGVLLAYAMDNKVTFQYLNKFFNYKYLSLISFIAMLILLSCFSGIWIGFPRIMVSIFSVCLLASCLFYPDHILSFIFNHKLIVRMGKISYGMYLFHGIIINVFRSSTFSGILNLEGILIFSIIMTVIFAELSYRCVELPFLRIKNTFIF